MGGAETGGPRFLVDAETGRDIPLGFDHRDLGVAIGGSAASGLLHPLAISSCPNASRCSELQATMRRSSGANNKETRFAAGCCFERAHLAPVNAGGGVGHRPAELRYANRSAGAGMRFRP